MFIQEKRAYKHFKDTSHPRKDFFEERFCVVNNSQDLQAEVDSLKDGAEIWPVFRLMLPALCHYTIPDENTHTHTLLNILNILSFSILLN